MKICKFRFVLRILIPLSPRLFVAVQVQGPHYPAVSLFALHLEGLSHNPACTAMPRAHSWNPHPQAEVCTPMVNPERGILAP